MIEVMFSCLSSNISVRFYLFLKAALCACLFIWLACLQYVFYLAVVSSVSYHSESLLLCLSLIQLVCLYYASCLSVFCVCRYLFYLFLKAYGCAFLLSGLSVSNIAFVSPICLLSHL